jgi:hypothetical protein
MQTARTDNPFFQLLRRPVHPRNSAVSVMVLDLVGSLLGTADEQIYEEVAILAQHKVRVIIFCCREITQSTHKGALALVKAQMLLLGYNYKMGLVAANDDLRQDLDRVTGGVQMAQSVFRFFADEKSAEETLVAELMEE